MNRILLIPIFFLLTLNAAMGQVVPCVGSQSLVANPPPNANGMYPVGTTVDFCYTVTDYAQSGVDWIAGVVPTFGPGWDLSTLMPTVIAPSCDGVGAWGWYTSCTGTASGATWGPGFYYDSPAGSPNNLIDGIPGNNFGDNCTSHTWEFCFSITVAPCGPPGTENLDVSVLALSDYQAGSWGTDGCLDPPATASATTLCNCALIISSINVVDASCGNSNDGEITVFPIGVAPYSYLWNNGATTQTISNIPPGIYTVTVTDSVFCVKTVTVPVGSPPPIILNEMVIDNICSPDSGSIQLSPSGGTGGVYTFLWNTGSTDSLLTNLSGGTYIVEVTDSNGCVAIDTFAISTVIPISLSTTSTMATCNGSDGSASVTATGGFLPLTYNWQPTGGNGPVATNLSSGTYTITVTDSNGCTAIDQVTVTEIGTFTLTSSFIPLGCDPLGTTTASVNVSGGSSPFTYQWTPSGGNQATATGLTSGTYVVFVTDSNNCVDSITVVIPPVIPLNATFNTTPVLCNQPNSGTASISVSGGVSPYSYLWSNGSSGNSITNLPGGYISVIVTDSAGCTLVDSVEVTIIPDVNISAGSNQTICSGDPVLLTGTVTGGTSPFIYSWNTGAATDTTTVYPTSTSTYSVTVTDLNGCSSISSVEITVIDYPVVTVSPDASICYGSSTTLMASGGTTYSWDPITGLNDASSSNPVASPLTTTTYTVTVSNLMCSSTGTVTVNVSPEVIAAFNPDSIQGQAPLTVNFNNTSIGGTGYQWNFGDGSTSTDNNPSHTYGTMGNYIVELIVTNDDGCSDTTRFSFIIVESTSSLVIPNVFTPNSDNFNDVFILEEIGIATIDVLILNRWGKEVYSWSQLNGSWDGKSDGGEDLPDGVYMYIIKAEGIDGVRYNESGPLHLIRNK